MPGIVRMTPVAQTPGTERPMELAYRADQIGPARPHESDMDKWTIVRVPRKDTRHETTFDRNGRVTGVNIIDKEDIAILANFDEFCIEWELALMEAEEVEDIDRGGDTGDQPDDGGGGVMP